MTHSVLIVEDDESTRARLVRAVASHPELEVVGEAGTRADGSKLLRRWAPDVLLVDLGLAYLEDGPDLLLMAMNGWAEPAPAWWLNLQAHPDASVDLPGGSRTVSARVAGEEERPRLWAKWAALTGGGMGADLDAYAAGISHETPLVILEPRPA